MGSTDVSLEPEPEPPPLVLRAEAFAARLGFTGSCEREVGRLLHVLAGERGRARVGEIGTGTGVSAAWIVSALPPDVPFVTVELEPERAAAAASLFRDDANVRVLEGDWHVVLPAEAPFDLLYDGGGKQRPDLDAEEVVALLAPRGLVVLDDLTPGRAREGDPVREFWLGHPELAAVELAVSPSLAVILAVRVR